MRLADAGRNATTLGVCCLSSTIGSNAQRVADFKARWVRRPKKPCSSIRLHWQAIHLRGFFLRPSGARISPQVPVSADLVEYEQAYR